jgi:hypothetical protein
MDIHRVTERPARTLFETIEAGRTRLGVPVAVLCRRADVNESAYRRLLRSRRRCPQWRTVSRLRTALAEFEENHK